MDAITIHGIGNVYGGLEIKKEDNKYYWLIEDYNTNLDNIDQYEQIPETLYNELYRHNLEAESRYCYKVFNREKVTRHAIDCKKRYKEAIYELHALEQQDNVLLPKFFILLKYKSAIDEMLSDLLGDYNKYTTSFFKFTNPLLWILIVLSCMKEVFMNYPFRLKPIK